MLLLLHLIVISLFFFFFTKMDHSYKHPKIIPSSSLLKRVDIGLVAPKLEDWIRHYISSEKREENDNVRNKEVRGIWKEEDRVTLLLG